MSWLIISLLYAVLASVALLLLARLLKPGSWEDRQRTELEARIAQDIAMHIDQDDDGDWSWCACYQGVPILAGHDCFPTASAAQLCAEAHRDGIARAILAQEELHMPYLDRTRAALRLAASDNGVTYDRLAAEAGCTLIQAYGELRRLERAGRLQGCGTSSGTVYRTVTA